jgi:basic membrane protein A
LVIVAIVFGSVGGFLILTNPYEPSRVAVVVMHPGFGDLSIADQLEVGMVELQRDISVSYFIPPDLPTNAVEAEETLSSLASNTGYYSIIVAVGLGMTSAVESAAASYPNQKFALIGGSVPGADNVVSATFATEQAAFLAGVLAAFLATAPDYSGIVGVLGAFENDPTLEPIINGFNQGVERANTDYGLNATLLEPRYIGSFNNSVTATTEVVNFFDPSNRNCSVLFAPVRGSMPGVRAGLEVANRSWYFDGYGDRIPLAIGAEFNLDYYGNPRIDVEFGPSWIATSVFPRSDLAITTILNRTLWDDFPGGELFEYDLANNGVNITSFRFSSTYINAVPNSQDALQQYRTMIINGSISVIP